MKSSGRFIQISLYFSWTDEEHRDNLQYPWCGLVRDGNIEYVDHQWRMPSEFTRAIMMKKPPAVPIFKAPSE